LSPQPTPTLAGSSFERVGTVTKLFSKNSKQFGSDASEEDTQKERTPRGCPFRNR
jgi:hypothetical protein